MEDVTIREVLRELRDFKERHVEFQTDVKARFTSIDASLSSLSPIITAHQERFKSLESNIETNCKRLDRAEQGVFGALVFIVVAVFTTAWNLLFPSK